MVLQLVSGPMLEKSKRTGPLADRQKVLLTARLGFFLFLGFKIFLGNSRKSSGFGKFPKIFAGNFFEFDYFDIFSDIQHFRYNF